MSKLTLKAIERAIAKLQVRAEKLRRKDKAPALREIIKAMQKNDISVAEVRKAFTGGRQSKGSVGTKRKYGKVKPLYRNPKTGETWSGRGRAARWSVTAEKAGRKRTEFLLKKG